MTNNTTTTTTASANFEAFLSAPEIKKGLQLSTFADLQKLDVNQGLASIRRQIKIGSIIQQSKVFLKEQSAALKAYGITGKMDEILSIIYGYQRAYVYMLIAAANNAYQLPAFEAYVNECREKGEKIPSVNLPCFARFCKGEKPVAEKRPVEGMRIEYNGKKFVRTAKLQKCELNAAQLRELIAALTNELTAQTESANLHQSKAQSKATNAANKAAKKAAIQPTAIA